MFAWCVKNPLLKKKLPFWLLCGLLIKDPLLKKEVLILWLKKNVLQIVSTAGIMWKGSPVTQEEALKQKGSPAEKRGPNIVF